MKIVHICSYFNTSKLYKNLFESLAKFNKKQEVFIPLYKNKPLVPENHGTVRKKEKNKKFIQYHYLNCLYKAERFFLKHRIKKIYKILLKKIEINKDTILHAHSLFANGGVCYLANKNKNINYIVAFRNTDLAIYKKLFYYRKLAKKIIKNSKKLIFISYSLKYKFLNIIKDKEFKKIIKNKSNVIPNGLSKSWFKEDIRKKSNKLLNKNKIKFIYQGTFHERKNVNYIIKIIEELNNRGINSNLKIVGGGPKKESLIKKIDSSMFNNNILLESWTNDSETLIRNYQNSDIFIMPSENETFGISYLEALAVGLPIIYKEREGIDGFFDEIDVGKRISTKNLYFDVKRILNLINNYKKYQANTSKIISKFKWGYISKRYIEIYNNI